jgi:hypothetical protein
VIGENVIPADEAMQAVIGAHRRFAPCSANRSRMNDSLEGRS